MRRTPALLLACALATTPALAAVTPATAADPVTVTKTTLHFRAPVEGGDCDVIGDLYVPSSATAATPAPAILTTNGFGGSKADQADVGAEMSARGYVVLSYSGLGFGGSGCTITTDDREHDGAAASALVGFLGGDDGVAFTSHDRSAGWTGPVPGLAVVRRDATDHAGVARSNDPRVGMVGGSYGGQVQFAAAAVDKRIDTIIPLITWSDLVFSLSPNNARADGTDLTETGPGVFKRQWSDFFTALGVSQVAQHADTTPLPPSSCPGFTPEICPATVSANANGYPDAAGTALFRNASVASYLDEITIPVLLAQGEADTLFTLAEAGATYRQLTARNVPTAMIWHSWGHSRIGAAPGEYVPSLAGLGPAGTLAETYEGRRIIEWFDHYLAGTGPAPALDFTYFRGWEYDAATGSDLDKATAAYGQSPVYPVARAERLFLSGTDTLTPSADRVSDGTTLVTSPGDAALESYSETSAVGIAGSYGSDVPQPPPFDPPGTFAAFSTEAFPADVDVVGVPHLSVTITADGVDASDPASQIVVFAKLYDVDASGALTLVERLVSPARLADLTRPVEIELPGIVHRVAAGHTLRLVLASSDQAYAGNLPGTTFSVVTSSTAPGVLTVPLAGSGTVVTTTPAPGTISPAAGTDPVRTATGASLATTGLTAAVPLVALALIATAVVLRRRRG